MKPSSVRHHVWWRALCMRLTWAMATFSPWRELNPLLWAKPDYIVLALYRIWHYIGLALCLIRSTGPAGFFTSGSSTAGTAGTKMPMGLLVDRKACWKLGKKNCSCNNSSNPSKGIYWAPCLALWAFPLPHARCLNHVLWFSLTSLTSSGTGTCRRYLCNPCVPYFRVLLETQEDAEMSISSKGVQFCYFLQKLHFKHLLRSVNILKSFCLEIIALHKCLIDTEAALKALINAYIPLEYVKISDWHLEKQTWTFLALITRSRKNVLLP